MTRSMSSENVRLGSKEVITQGATSTVKDIELVESVSVG